jgi:hypothetical protein
MAPLPSPNVFKGREVQDDIKRIEEKIKKAKTPQARQKWIERLAAVKKLGKLPKDPKKTPKTKKSLLKHKTPKQPPPSKSILGRSSGALGDRTYHVEADDWWGEDEDTDTDWWKAKPEFGRSPGALGGRHDPWEGFKHGGRIKKTKKRKSKRAALRGHRKELRGG